MKNELIKIMVCPNCGGNLRKVSGKLVCTKKHKFKLIGSVPVFSQLDPYLEIEAKAWEDEWRKGVSKESLNAYKVNMQVFKKLGFWEESGEAAGFIPSNKEFRVLDLGCGNGVSTANIEGSVVVGMDLSTNQMVRAKKRFKNTNYVVGDATKIPFRDNTFDLVVSINLLHHIKDSGKVLKEIHRVLKKGGKSLTVDPNLYNPIGFTGRELFKLLGLKHIFPTIPQFALGEDERQFTKSGYYSLFKKSKFKNFRIIPHRIERLLFFGSVLFPPLTKLSFFKDLLIFTSKFGNKLVQIEPFDNICYFWKAEAIK